MNPANAEELGRLRPRLVRYAIRRLGNRERAEDAVQEALLAALEGLERYRGGSSLGTWLTGILKHKIADSMRSRYREAGAEPGEAELPDSDPAKSYERVRVLERVQRGLERLPHKMARVFVLREVIGVETPVICRELSISAANCCVLAHRARGRLRECPELAQLAAA
jgi:RNA polymerase sigma-70 factor (ECF subfamily)